MSIYDSQTKTRALGARPEFYLIYLLFYFVPWLFQPPTTIDIIAISVALAVFLPIYLTAFKDSSRGDVRYIIAIALVGYLLSPFNGGFGVFHIYATVQATFARPERRAWVGMICLAVFFLCFCLVTDQHWSIWVFPLFIGLLVGVGTMYGAEQEERQAALVRSREHDTHMAALAERERIAQDLHDLLGQTLTMVALKSDVASKLIDNDPQRAKQEINEIRQASRHALSDVRKAVANMNQTTIAKEIGRAEAILKSAGVELVVAGELPDLDTETDRTLGLAVRETTTNIVRHAQATSAKLSLSQTHLGELQLIIEDNGHGIIKREGSGLRGLRKRIEGLGGMTKIDTDSGVRMILTLPPPSLG